MTYYKVESDYSGGGSEQLRIHLYPNETVDDSSVQSYGVVRAGAESFVTQLINHDVIGSYEIYISYEHPGITPYNDAKNSMAVWSQYDGPNNKLSRVGCHLLVYQVSNMPANGAADHVNWGTGAFGTSKGCVMVLSPQSSTPTHKQATIHEIGHTCIVDDESGVTYGLGDSDTSDLVDHELGQVYPGWAGDGPSSPMCTGYVDSEGREGQCSNNAPWNWTLDEKLSDCTKEAIELTANQ